MAVLIALRSVVMDYSSLHNNVMMVIHSQEMAVVLSAQLNMASRAPLLSPPSALTPSLLSSQLFRYLP